jgi:integrase
MHMENTDNFKESRKRRPFTARSIQTMKDAGRYGDGTCKGLWLQVSDAGTKSWLLRYMLNGRARAMGLGSLELVSLADARERARAARRLLLDGKDPIEERKAQQLANQLAAARSVTFQKCAERYLAAHEASWRNPKHRAQWRSTLATYAYPTLGALPVASVDTQLVLRVLEPLWTKRPETAGRLRGRIQSVLDWATARGYRQGENPARWRGHLDTLLPLRSKIAPVQHHPAMPYIELPNFMVELRGNASISASALEMKILTASRTGEIIGATWPEINSLGRVWTVPANRMKGGRPHRVPLSDRCMTILESLPRIVGCEYLFPGGRPGKPLSNMALLELMRGLRPAFVPHGFRSTFKDWATETTDHPRDIVEAALAHVIGDKVEAAYRRGDALEKRRRLMTDWATFCEGRQ